jgi:hypothetical protein
MSAPGSVPGSAGRLAGFAERVRNLLVRPYREWQAIADEPTTTREIYLEYVAPLAAMAIAGAFVGNTLVGVEDGMRTLRAGLAAASVAAVTAFALALAGVFLLSRLTAKSAGRGDQRRTLSLRVVAYSMTPVWLAGIVAGVPLLTPLLLVGGLYGVLLLILGLRLVLRCEWIEAIAQAAIVTAGALVLGLGALFVIGFTSGLAGVGKPLLRGGPADVARYAGAAGGIVGRALAESDAEGRARMGDAVGGVGTSIADMFRSPPRGRDLFEQLEYTVAVLGASGRMVEPVPPEALAALLPPSLRGMWRTEIAAGPETQRKLRGSSARARYENSESSITLSVADAGESAGLLRVLAWFDPHLDRTTAWGYERRRRHEGRFVDEKYNHADRYGKVGVIVADRFVVGAEGSNVDAAALSEAVQAVDANLLMALAPR